MARGIKFLFTIAICGGLVSTWILSDLRASTRTIDIRNKEKVVRIENKTLPQKKETSRLQKKSPPKIESPKKSYQRPKTDYSQRYGGHESRRVDLEIQRERQEHARNEKLRDLELKREAKRIDLEIQRERQEHARNEKIRELELRKEAKRQEQERALQEEEWLREEHLRELEHQKNLERIYLQNKLERSQRLREADLEKGAPPAYSETYVQKNHPVVVPTEHPKEVVYQEHPVSNELPATGINPLHALAGLPAVAASLKTYLDSRKKLKKSYLKI
jgi:hypothetical protein